MEKEKRDQWFPVSDYCKEQSAVSEMISKSVSQIAALAEDSMTAAEQTAHAATELSDTGRQLGELVKRFEL